MGLQVRWLVEQGALDFDLTSPALLAIAARLEAMAGRRRHDPGPSPAGDGRESHQRAMAATQNPHADSGTSHRTRLPT
jgi:hypothetical protein